MPTLDIMMRRERAARNRLNLLTDSPKPNYTVVEIEQALEHARVWEAMTEEEQQEAIGIHKQNKITKGQEGMIYQDNIEVIRGFLGDYIFESGEPYRINPRSRTVAVKGVLSNQENGDKIENLYSGSIMHGRGSKEVAMKEAGKRAMVGLRYNAERVIEKYEEPIIQLNSEKYAPKKSMMKFDPHQRENYQKMPEEKQAVTLA
ncbi:MAG: hypothetical protein FWE31_00340 [Firmicutes bacterium]|nr:hypothetical protein [Bacillota bacterium]